MSKRRRPSQRHSCTAVGRLVAHATQHNVMPRLSKQAGRAREQWPIDNMLVTTTVPAAPAPMWTRTSSPAPVLFMRPVASAS